MKLLNNTKVPDDILERVLTKAGRAVSARTTRVVVQVNSTKTRLYSRGTAIACDWVRWYDGTKYKWNKKSGKIIKRPRRLDTDGGAFKITLPIPVLISRFVDSKTLNELDFAQRFYDVARHEWGHIKDYQKLMRGKRLAWSSIRAGHRRVKHGDRPEEVRAYNYVYESNLDKRDENWAYEEITNLGIAIENIVKQEKV